MTNNPTPRRNDPCPCGSGRKAKKCCGPELWAHARLQREADAEQFARACRVVGLRQRVKKRREAAGEGARKLASENPLKGKGE